MKPIRYGLHRLECELRTKAAWPPLGPWFGWLAANVVMMALLVGGLQQRRWWQVVAAVLGSFLVNELFVPLVWRAFRAASRKSRLVVDRDAMLIETWAGVRRWELDGSIECSAHPGGLLISCSDDSVYLLASAHEQEELEALAAAICRAADSAPGTRVPAVPASLQSLLNR